MKPEDAKVGMKVVLVKPWNANETGLEGTVLTISAVRDAVGFWSTEKVVGNNERSIGCWTFSQVEPLLTEFKQGHWYKHIAKKHTDNWVDAMDAVLDGNPHKAEIVYTKGDRVSFSGVVGIPWTWEPSEFIEVPAPSISVANEASNVAVNPVISVHLSTEDYDEDYDEDTDEHSQEDIKMHIEDVSKANLRLAKKQFEEQHKTAQVEFALEQYRRLQDTKESLETTIRVTQEKLDEVDKELARFK